MFINTFHYRLIFYQCIIELVYLFFIILFKYFFYYAVNNMYRTIKQTIQSQGNKEKEKKNIV